MKAKQKPRVGWRDDFRGNSFNDIAIQLTAYAVSTGKSETEFLAGCKPFIENYPSSSLTTIEKRYGNCRDRYRTMAGNGCQHSCGGVLALKIPGYECGFCSMGQPEPDQQEPEPASPAKLMEVFEVKKEYVNKLGKEEYHVPSLFVELVTCKVLQKIVDHST